MNFEIENVIQFANNAHLGQVRKSSGLPYIVHPIDVLQVIGKQWQINDLDVWKAAVCHDVLEDTDVTCEELQKHIGEKATSIVVELTFRFDPDDNLKKSDQKHRYMKTFNEKSVEALVIKVADRLCNVYDFILSETDYARKYWQKANGLMNNMFSRKSEIVSRFGSDAYWRMEHTHHLISRQIGETA